MLFQKLCASFYIALLLDRVKLIFTALFLDACPFLCLIFLSEHAMPCFSRNVLLLLIDTFDNNVFLIFVYESCTVFFMPFLRLGSVQGQIHAP